jgi:hypothetical protein
LAARAFVLLFVVLRVEFGVPLSGTTDPTPVVEVAHGSVILAHAISLHFSSACSANARMMYGGASDKSAGYWAENGQDSQ